MGIPPRRSLLKATALAMVLAVTGITLTVAASKMTQVASIQTEALSLRHPSVLSAIDRVRYRQAFRMERAGQQAEAEAVLAHVDDKVLRDVVHSDKSETAALPVGSNRMVSNGYTRSQLAGHKQWQAAIAAYKDRNFAGAARQFRLLADSEKNLTGEDKAAAAFWAYRSLKKDGNALASRYLKMAAEAPTGFYSLMAGVLLEDKSGPIPVPAASDPAVMQPLEQNPAIRKAIALYEIDEKALAEDELRAAYLWGDRATRASLLSLARVMDMPSLQMRMTSASAPGTADAFPMPRWEPVSGYQLERALLFAIMRQESGFNPDARSASGAVGLMQLMPGTMQDMARGSQSLQQGADPAVNISLGQRYLEHLMETPQIGDNLIYLTASYNAGPGTVVNWLRADGGYHDDPLLFVETMPNGQTRDYVQHVIANYWVYSSLLGKEQSPSLRALSAGNWPRYEGAERQLVSLLTQAD